MSSDEQQQSRLFNELCTLFLALVRSPHLFFPSSPSPSPRLRSGARRPRRRSQLSPSGLALLLLGASLALMICGSVTFMLGFILIPWVIGFVMVMYFVGIISILSEFGKAIFFPAVPTPSLTSPEERLVPHQPTQYPTSEELSIQKIKFMAFDLGGHQIAWWVWKDYYARV